MCVACVCMRVHACACVCMRVACAWHACGTCCVPPFVHVCVCVAPWLTNVRPSYMTLLNTFANLGGTWPAGPMLWIAGEVDYYKLQLGLSLMGLLWVSKMAPRVEYLANTDESEWRSKEGRGREAGKNV